MRREILLLGAAFLAGGTARSQPPSLAPTAGTPPGPPPPSVRDAAAVPVPAPQPAPPPVEDLRSFDPMRVELQWASNNWRLLADGAILKDFGRHEAEARQAIRVIRELRLTQHGTVGSPSPLMEYWLSDGRAPQGHVTGLHAQALDPATLRAEQTQGQWCLRDARRVLFNFGLHGDDALRACDLLRKYGFTQVATLDPLTPSMMVFLRRPSDGPYDGAPSGVTQASFRKGRGPGDDGGTPFSAADRELRRMQSRFPGAGVSTLVTPAVRPLQTTGRERDQPRSPFAGGASAREIKVPGHGAANGPWADVLHDPSDRVPVDWRRAQARQEGGAWKLVDGGNILAEFGADEAAARTALEAVRYYRPTERCHVGPAGAGCTYFLANGQAPRGVMLGVSGQTLQPDALRVGPAEGGWAVCDGPRAVLFCGARADDAREMLEVIQRYRFDRLCRIGAVGHGLTFLARTR